MPWVNKSYVTKPTSQFLSIFVKGDWQPNKWETKPCVIWIQYGKQASFYEDKFHFSSVEMLLLVFRSDVLPTFAYLYPSKLGLC